MRNSKGFSLSEVIIAMGIIMMLVATVLPIHHMLKTEQQRIKQHQLIKAALHDELQEAIWIGMPSEVYKLKVAAKTVDIFFTMEESYVRGCARWENAHKKNEKVCLYGIKEN